MTKNEIILYIGVAIAVLLNELGWGPITFAPSLLIVLWLAYRAFPALPKSSNLEE